MERSNRIDITLLDDELRDLINASSKIFPITQNDVDTNYNPNNYEYGRVGNSIYRWDGYSWGYIVADDTDIDWLDIKRKPSTYPPSTHTHSELHSHSNKSVLDKITQLLLDKWDSVVNKADKVYVDAELDNKSDITHTHDYSPSNHNHDTSYYKKTEIDTKLNSKSDSTHNHDGAYHKKAEVISLLGGKANTVHVHTEESITNLDKYTKAEVDTKLGDKASASHTHTELHTHNNKSIIDKLIETSPSATYDLSNLDYIEDIKNGYTEGHIHDNMTVLDSITQALVDGWNSAVTHISDMVKHITSSERTLWNTVSSKEPIIVKNTAFNKDFGNTAGTVTQGNDSRLSDARTPTSHNHNTLYNTKLEITTLLDGKSDVTHTHAGFALATHNHDDRYYTESEIDNKLSGKVENTTFTGHTSNTTVHVTQLDKNNWNGKLNASDLPPPVDISGLESELEKAKVTIGTVKPTNGSMWYEVIG